MTVLEQTVSTRAIPFPKALAKTEQKLRRRPASVLLLFVLLYTVFLLSLATVYGMNLAWITPYTAVALLSVCSIAALLLLFRIIQAR